MAIDSTKINNSILSFDFTKKADGDLNSKENLFLSITKLRPKAFIDIEKIKAQKDAISAEVELSQAYTMNEKPKFDTSI